MISQERIREIKNSQIEYAKREFQNSDKNEIISKIAIVKETTPLGEKLNYKKGEEVTEKGKGFTHFSWKLERTVFRENPIEHNGSNYYKELKGYGANGRVLFPYHHCEGDLHFGMYFNNAKREFEIMKVASEASKEGSTHPVALMIFSEEEFIKNCIEGVKSLSPNMDKKDTEEYMAIYKKEGIESLKNSIIGKTGSMIKHRLEELITITESAGYLIRIAKSPQRIYDANKEDGPNIKVSTSDLEEAVYNAGKTYTLLINKGIIHMYPNLRNITLAGELTDYEDACKVTDHKEICDTLEFAREFIPKKGKTSNHLEDFLTYVLGENMLLEYSGCFLEGVGRGKNPRKVASSIIEQHKESLRELIKTPVL